MNAAFGAANRTAICPRTGRHYISVRATRNIKAGTEILVSYGPAYWDKGGFRVDGKRPACTKVPPPLDTAIIATPAVTAGEDNRWAIVY